MKNKNKFLRKKKYFTPNNFLISKIKKKPLLNLEEIYESISIIDFIIKIILIIIIYIIYIFLPNNKSKIKVALCTMGRKENLYINEYVNHYLSLGVDTLFLYDDNVDEKDKFINFIPKTDSIVIEYTKDYDIDGQVEAFNHCYKTNKNNYDWFIMVDMDEFVVIRNNDTIKKYLSDKVFDKCDFIKLQWRVPTDNDLVYYDNRSLFERFKRPFMTYPDVKSIIRGHIDNLKYWVHSPKESPDKNVTCDNTGNILHYTKLNFERVSKVNLDRAYILHFAFKSTEEFINKFNRGYKNWPHLKLEHSINNYFSKNRITLEKIELLEKAFNITLTRFRNKLHLSI